MKKLLIAIVLGMATTALFSCGGDDEEKNNGPATTASADKTPPPQNQATVDPTPPTPQPTAKTEAEFIKLIGDKEYGEYVLQVYAANSSFDPHLVCVRLEKLDLEHLTDFDSTYIFDDVYLFSIYTRMLVNKVPSNSPKEFKMVQDFISVNAPNYNLKYCWLESLTTCKLPKYLKDPDKKIDPKLLKELEGKETGYDILYFYQQHTEIDPHEICVQLEKRSFEQLTEFGGVDYTFDDIYLFSVYTRMLINKVPLNSPKEYKVVQDFIHYKFDGPLQEYWMVWLAKCKLPKYLARVTDDDE